MAINIKRVSNGWVVEIWRAKCKLEEFVFPDRAAMVTFVDQINCEAE